MAIGKDRRFELRALTVGPDNSVRDVLNLMNLKDELLDELDRLDAENDTLRDALDCWPLKELIKLARESGNERMANLFVEVRDDALRDEVPS